MIRHAAHANNMIIIFWKYKENSDPRPSSDTTTIADYDLNKKENYLLLNGGRSWPLNKLSRFDMQFHRFFNRYSNRIFDLRYIKWKLGWKWKIQGQSFLLYIYDHITKYNFFYTFVNRSHKSLSFSYFTYKLYFKEVQDIYKNNTKNFESL